MPMKIALVHDDLFQWGGAERVLEALGEAFPDAPIYTSVVNWTNPLIKQNFGHKNISTSFLQKIPGWKFFYKALLPLYPLAFEQFDLSEYDVVISQTTRFAKSIITKPHTLHICYCHTPPRFLWNFSGERSLGILQPVLSYLRFYDQVSSHRVDTWIAGSVNAQNRIKKIYQQDSQVIYPFVDLERFKNVKTFQGGYLLSVSRLNSYKRVDLVIQAANRLGIPLKVVGDGPLLDKLKTIAGPTVEFLGMINEDLLTFLLSGCQALVVAGEEDFGLTALEAQALGKPVIAYGAGGALETVVEGETGYLFKEQTMESLIEALSKLDKQGYNKKRCLAQAASFSKERFINNFTKLVSNLA